MEKHTDAPAPVTRRTFVRTTALAGAGMMLGSKPFTTAVAGRDRRRRYAVVGTGSRAYMYLEAIGDRYRAHAELVGLCDANEGRLHMAQAWAAEATGASVPVFSPDAFDEMIERTRPDVVIVTTVDAFHDRYIVRAMELGCDAVTEKPMTTDAAKCRQIVDAQRSTGKRCTVTFNYRYSPPRTQVKELLMRGAIGEVLSVDFQWLLNTHHGADYFRRWHSRKALSGGLLVHKATHHFDLVNWWLSAVPVTVSAQGQRRFYTPEMARRLGLQGPHARCRTCPEKAQCGFELDLAANRGLKALYLDHEHHDGYHRDQCVFRPEIDIEDSMSALVQYDDGVQLSYSLDAFNAWEGYVISFNGTKGRLEHQIQEAVYVNGTDTVQGGIREGGTFTRIIPLRGATQEVEPWRGEGSHGGGDRLLLDQLFLPEPPADPYRRAADHRAGAYSVLTGVAANISIAEGRPVRIDTLVQGIGYPDYTEKPSRTAALPMPEKG